MHKQFLNPEGIYIKEGRALVYVAYKNLMWAEADGNYIILHIYHQKKRTTRLPLSDLMKKLPPGRFIRVHKAYMVHVACVTELHANMICIGQAQIPIGRSYKKQVEEHFSQTGKPAHSIA
jgi:two-component system, LytTR family, response regulator